MMLIEETADYANMVRRKEEILNIPEEEWKPEFEKELTDLTKGIMAYKKKYFKKQEATAICKEAKDGYRYHDNNG